MTRMKTPAFFDAVPPIVVFDPLAEVLGAAENGIVDYRYADAVKLAGHSCPTVACAWLMTRRALQELYPDTLPCRGDVRVELRAASEEGVTGVIASIAGLVTGAANESGFKGLAGRFGRRGLLRFGVPLGGRDSIHASRYRSFSHAVARFASRGAAAGAQETVARSFRAGCIGPCAQGICGCLAGLGEDNTHRACR